MSKSASALRIEYLPIDDLLPYARNMNDHSEEHVAEIAASMKEFGWTNPVLIDKESALVAGHGRILAARRLGIDQIPCIRRDHWTETQVRAYRIADNRIPKNATVRTDMLSLELKDLKLDDFDLDLLGFDDGELDALLNPEEGGTEGNTDPDAVPENVETRCKPGDLWILGKHRMLCGDSTNVLDVERLMGGEKADLIFTDPPYGVSYADKNAFLNAFSKGNAVQKRIENDHMKPDEMNEFWFTVLSNAYIASSDRCSYYICSPQGGDLMMMMSIIRAGWQLKHMLIWVKNNPVLGRCDYNYKHEPILYGWKDGGTHDFVGGGRCKTSVWDFNKPMKNDLHPTMKPVELCEEAIQNSSRRDQAVLDLFLGSGSTLIACEKTGRRCFGMEIDPKYCDVILTRWEQFTGKTAELADA